MLERVHVLLRAVLWDRPRCVCAVWLMLACARALAVPADLPITNTATASFVLAGERMQVQASHTVRTDADAGNSPPYEIALDGGSVPANVAGATVGPLIVRDPDTGDAHTLQTDDARFEVVGGVLKLVPDQSLVPGARVQVTVTATDPGGLSYSQPFEVRSGSDVAPAASLTIRQIAADGEAFDVPAGQCVSQGGAHPAGAVHDVRGDMLPLPGVQRIAATRSLKSGDVAFFTLVDHAANVDPVRAEEVDLLVRARSGDEQTLRLRETANDSGVFAGYVQTQRGTAVAGDCVLQSVVDDELTAIYQSVGGAAVVRSSAWVDPLGRVFAAGSGRLVDDVEVRLLVAATGELATVYGDDGRSAYPAVVRTGSTVSDSAGALYTLPAGSFRFPVVPPGSYRLEVDTPARFAFPSRVTDARLQSLPGAPFRLSAASRGEPLLVGGWTLAVDLPLDLAPVTPTPATLETYLLTPGQAAQTLAIASGACAPSATTRLGDVALPADLGVTAARRFRRGDAIVFQLVDADQDMDPFARERVTIEVQTSVDSQEVVLQETGTATGVFTGVLNTGEVAGSSTDCLLGGSVGSRVMVRYIDPDDASDVVLTEGTLDPLITLFSSATGAPVDGATVRIIDATSGAQANVLASDGATGYPATLTSGGAAVDDGGNRHDFPPGSVYVPHLPPGTYRFEVVPPEGFAFPSVRTDAQLAGLADNRFVIVEGSRGEAFQQLAGLTSAFDVPLDPREASLFLSKSASSDVVSVGESVQYLVSLQAVNTGAPLIGLAVIDDLPHGFRYRPGSARLDGREIDDPVVSPDGTNLRFDLSGQNISGIAELRYVALATTQAEQGSARNRVTATAANLTQVNVAYADVLVRDALFAEEAFLSGRVSDGCDGAGDGIAGVRVLLEDGTYALTDRDGRYHFEGLTSGTHVVQLDPTSIPDGFAVEPCRGNSRSNGDPGGRFTELRPGTLWQEHFRVRSKPRIDRWETQLHAHAVAGRVRYTLELAAGDVAAQRGSVTLLLDERARYLPGSARFDGRVVAPKLSDGVLTVPLPAMAAGGRYALRFDAQVPDDGGPVVTRASVWLTTEHGKHRSDAMTNMALPAAADERLYIVAEGKAVPASAPIRGHSRAFEPVDRGKRSSSDPAMLEVSLPASKAGALPYTLPSVGEVAMPEFDANWLASADATEAMVWPPERFNPRTPSVSVVITHRKSWRPALVVDGRLVDAVSFEGTVVDAARGVAVTRWQNVPISEGDSRIEAQFLDGQGAVQARLARAVHFSQAPARAELVAEESWLVADGVHPPVLAVRFFDVAGYPVRPGLSGEFSVRAPYRALDEARHLEVIDQATALDRYQVRRDGTAYIQLEPTTEAGDVSLAFQFDRHRVETVRARLAPGVRDWVLVGLLESGVQFEHASGAAEDDSSEVLHDGRAAFYAKGVVKGEWLLTAAYDTDKRRERQVLEAIDPNRFYTLYGDGSEQRQDARSQRKLYLKLERQNFAFEAGDFDTGFDRAELARYERRLSGVRADYYGERVRAKVFASDTDQRLVFDVLPGDGTSGLYRLSKNRVVAGSEQIRLVTRDRFHTQRELTATSLTRHVDYTIDYDAGTVLFKQPVLSQDFEFNPTTIEVRYEVDGAESGGDLLAGTRLAWALDQRDSEIGVSYIDDGNVAQRLLAADLHLRIGNRSELDLEAAATTADGASARALLAGYRYRGERLAGGAYLRRVEQGFGLGQQAASENDTLKYGVEGEYALAEGLTLRAEAFRQETIEQGGERQVLLAEGRYRRGAYNYHAGLQQAAEQTPAGTRRQSNLVTFGAGSTLLGGRLLLRGDSELALGGDAEVRDYPSRATFGAEFDVWNDVTLIAEHELGFGADVDTQDSRFGVRARPWTGHRVESYLGRQMTESGERLFSTTGLIQQIRLSDRWLLDVGADRTQTLKGVAPDRNEVAFNPAQPPASGSYDNDFSAAFLGAAYRRDAWNANARVEFHAGERTDKWNVLFGAARQLEAGRALSGSAQWLSERSADGSLRDTARLRLGTAWRPQDSGWLVLNRLDLEAEHSRGTTFDTTARKVVENLHFNRRWQRHELSLHLGAKYVVQQFDGDTYDSITALIAADYRFDLTDKWDLGAHVGARASVDASVAQTSVGISVGRSFFGNAWVSTGYNFSGFIDDDFAGAEYRRAGAFLKLRLRVDQQMAGRFLSFVGWGRGSEVTHENMQANAR